LVAIKY